MLIKEIRKNGEVHITLLKDMQNLFKNAEGCNPNQEIYRVLVISRNEMSYAITIMKPGKINGEFFMTRGHSHNMLSPEIYYPLKGNGLLIIQKGSDFKAIKMQKEKFYEIPEGYAHRTINIGKQVLEVLNIYSSNSGHNYKKIEKEGFKKRFY